ncbi:UvrD-helicase domain-containing protein [Raineyella fluvialis]|nr:UvrD-helicase domain-containing protein [Raineyella fluvialis]
MDGTAGASSIALAEQVAAEDRRLGGVRLLDAGPVLDVDQQVVVDHERGPLLVLGASGTGKTTALVESAVSLVRHRGVPPECVLVLTFSRGATRTLAERIAGRLGEVAAAVPVLSVHGLCHALWAEAHRTDPWRVLTAPEQELRLREVLEGSAEPWPEDLREAVGTRVFTRELRDLVARARQLGLDPADVADFGEQDGRPAWVRAAHLFEEYLDVLDAERVLDYDELVHRVRIMLADPRSGDPLRSRWDHVLVDDLQDAVPAHAALLRDLVPPSSSAGLVVTADPDRAVYSFRGADGGVVARFGTDHAGPGGEPAAVHVLGTDHRGAPVVSRSVHGLTAAMARPFGLPDWRAPRPGRVRDGAARLVLCADAREEATAVAATLLAAHAERGIAWHRMAVVVRSRGPEEALLRRRLGRAGVPIAVPDDTPLVDEPAVRVLLEVLETALGPDEVGAEELDRLALSPLGGVDPMELRRHRKFLGASDRDRAEGGLARVRRRLDAVQGPSRRPGRRSRRVAARRRCCGRPGRPQTGRSASGRPRSVVAARPSGPIATWTRWWPCSTWPVVAARVGAVPPPQTSSRRSAIRRSRPMHG